MTFVSLSPPLLDFRLWKAFSSAKMWIFFPASSAKKMEQKESLHNEAKSSGSTANLQKYFLIQLSLTFRWSVKKGQIPFLELSKIFWNTYLLIIKVWQTISYFWHFSIKLISDTLFFIKWCPIFGGSCKSHRKKNVFP